METIDLSSQENITETDKLLVEPTPQDKKPYTRLVLLIILLFVSICLVGLIAFANNGRVNMNYSKQGEQYNPSEVEITLNVNPTSTVVAKSNNSTPTNLAVSQSPTPIVTPTVPPMVSVTKLKKLTPEKLADIKWGSYTHEKFADLPNWKINWHGFTIYYPTNWEFKVDRQVGDESVYLNIKIIAPNKDKIEISQGPGGGTPCFFPDGEINPAWGVTPTTYTQFFELNKGEEIWRVHDDFSYPLWTYGLCSGNYNANGQTNFASDSGAIGYFKILITSDENLSILWEILNRIKIDNT